MEKELQYFGKVLENPDRPVVAILGGAKVSGKIKVINNLLKKVDKLIIGGGMMFTFLKAQGYEIGTSLVEGDRLEVAKSVLKQAEEKGIKLYLPVDCVVADNIEAPTVTKMVNVRENSEKFEGIGYWARIAETVCASFSRRENDYLEWANGRVRGRSL